jgi:hypothetical protein
MQPILFFGDGFLHAALEQHFLTPFAAQTPSGSKHSRATHLSSTLHSTLLPSTPSKNARNGFACPASYTLSQLYQHAY